MNIIAGYGKVGHWVYNRLAIKPETYDISDRTPKDNYEYCFICVPTDNNLEYTEEYIEDVISKIKSDHYVVCSTVRPDFYDRHPDFISMPEFNTVNSENAAHNSLLLCSRDISHLFHDEMFILEDRPKDCAAVKLYINCLLANRVLFNKWWQENYFENIANVAAIIDDRVGWSHNNYIDGTVDSSHCFNFALKLFNEIKHD